VADLGQLVEVFQHLGDDRHGGSDRSAIATHHSGIEPLRPRLPIGGLASNPRVASSPLIAEGAGCPMAACQVSP
jgi:hypothetical protein